MLATVPDLRVRAVNDRPVRPDGEFVLYWITGNRRSRWNFSLQRAVAHAVTLGKPLVVLELLSCTLPWGSDRIHAAILDGMADLAEAFARKGVTYYPFAEPRPGEVWALLQALGDRACVVVTDDFPCYIVPGAIANAGENLETRVEAVDSNGLLPMGATDQAFTLAHAFRRFLHKQLAPHLMAFPVADPLSGVVLPPGGVPADIAARYPATPAGSIRDYGDWPIDHRVRPADGFKGGEREGAWVLERFIDERLDAYPEARNVPDTEGGSGLSPYLHFGFVSAHEVVARLFERAEWHPGRLGRPSGSREGWWGLPPASEAFMDQLVTWRELGFNAARHLPGYDRYESLPAWALKTLAEHAHDPRPVVYDLQTLAESETHDPLWNAAQRQLVREGRIHNYLRMLWGKKILQWTASPEEAARVMIELNNLYALDGRDPNSYSGIFWTLGRYDRAWGPERPIFGKIRYMASENTARKWPVKGYLARYGAPT